MVESAKSFRKGVNMSKLVLDAATLAKLKELVQPVEVCDASGQVVGRFFPKLDPSKYNLEPQISKEEIQRRLQDKGKGYTTAEVLAYLEKL